MTDLRKAAEALVKHWEAGEFQNCTGNMAGHIQLLRQTLAMERFSEVNQEIEQELKNPSWKNLGDEDIEEIETLYYHDKLYDIADLCREVEKRLMKKNIGGNNV